MKYTREKHHNYNVDVIQKPFPVVLARVPVDRKKRNPVKQLMMTKLGSPLAAITGETV
jgi:hypothetical protein